MFHRTLTEGSVLFIIVALAFLLSGVFIFARELGHFLLVLRHKLKPSLVQYSRSFLLSRVDRCMRMRNRKRLMNLLKSQRQTKRRSSHTRGFLQSVKFQWDHRAKK